MSQMLVVPPAAPRYIIVLPGDVTQQRAAAFQEAWLDAGLRGVLTLSGDIKVIDLDTGRTYGGADRLTDPTKVQTSEAAGWAVLIAIVISVLAMATAIYAMSVP